MLKQAPAQTSCDCGKFSQFLIALYNICNGTIFFHTANDFPVDMAFADRKVIEKVDDLGSLNGVLLLLASLILLISNQRAFTSNFQRALDERRGETSTAAPSSGWRKNFAVADSMITAGYKSTVLVFAVTASIKEAFGINSDAGKYTTLGLSSLTLAGSFAAELSIYIRQYIKTDVLSCLRGRFKKPMLASHLLVLIFNICDLLLYFNNFDKWRESLALTDHRLSKLQDPWDIFLFSYAVFSSGCFLFATQRSFSRMVGDLFKKQDQLLASAEEKEDGPWMRKFAQVTAYNSIFYKTVNVTLAFMTILFLLSDGNWAITGIAGILSFLGNCAAQYSIYAPTRESQATLFNGKAPTTFYDNSMGATESIDSVGVAQNISYESS